jgi:hypothetical protein
MSTTDRTTATTTTGTDDDVEGFALTAYLKIPTIDGESKDEKHDKWIDVLNVDWGLQATVRPRLGT